MNCHTAVGILAAAFTIAVELSALEDTEPTIIFPSGCTTALPMLKLHAAQSNEVSKLPSELPRTRLIFATPLKINVPRE